MRFTLPSFASALLLANGAAALPGLFGGKDCTDPNIIAHTGNPQGSTQTIQNGEGEPVSARRLPARN
jgi:hypothetical protein